MNERRMTIIDICTILVVVLLAVLAWDRIVRPRDAPTGSPVKIVISLDEYTLRALDLISNGDGLHGSSAWNAFPPSTVGQ